VYACIITVTQHDDDDDDDDDDDAVPALEYRLILVAYSTGWSVIKLLQ